MLICCSRNITYYCQCWKQFFSCCCFLWKPSSASSDPPSPNCI